MEASLNSIAQAFAGPPQLLVLPEAIGRESDVNRALDGNTYPS